MQHAGQIPETNPTTVLPRSHRIGWLYTWQHQASRSVNWSDNWPHSGTKFQPTVWEWSPYLSFHKHKHTTTWQVQSCLF